MKRAVHRAGFRPLAMGSTRLLLRPALKIAAFILFILLTLGLYSLSRGSFPAAVFDMGACAAGAGADWRAATLYPV